MTGRRGVGLSAPGLHTAAGSGTGAVWEALAYGKSTRTPGEFLGGPWPDIGEAFFADDPDAVTLGLHRRVLRTTEKQSRMALRGAGLSLRGQGDVGGDRAGLYLGLPTVDEELLPARSVPKLAHAASSPAQIAEVFGRDISPFRGLSHLNSTVAAHVSATFGLTGAMAAYSPFSDAGLHALIDGVLSIVEGENDTALIGATSPKIHPLLLAQYESFGWRGEAPGEGSAFLLARGAAAESDPVLAGYGRTFATGAGDRSAALSTAIKKALAMAGIEPGGIGWVLPDVTWTDATARAQTDALTEVFGADAAASALSAYDATGVLGPAQPLTHVLLALHGMETGMRLVSRGGAVGAEPLRHPTAIIVACGVRGQMVAVVLRGVES